MRSRAVRLSLRASAATAVAVVGAASAAVPALAHAGVPDAPPDAVGILTTWTLEPTIVVPLLASLVAWALIVRRIDRQHPDTPVPFRRTLAFYGGLLAIAVALLSGIERYDTTLFSVHMIQHLLLVFVAAPLIALAAPITQVLRASSPEFRTRWVLPALHSRVVSFLAHPVVAWISFTAVMWLSHFSPLFEASLEDPGIHEIEHVLFLVSALLFWWPVIALDPAPHRMGPPARLMYTFLQMPQNSFLAMAVLFAEDPLYPHYVSLASPYGIDALSDQKLAAGFMWFFGDLVFLFALIVLLAVWIRREERDTAANDRRDDAQRAALDRRADELAERRAGVTAEAARMGGVAEMGPAEVSAVSGLSAPTALAAPAAPEAPDASAVRAVGSYEVGGADVGRGDSSSSR